MMRSCSHCGHSYQPADLIREQSRGMEAERKAMGLQGVLFRYYHCPACARDDIFVVIRPMEGEPPEAFRRRRDELEAAVRDMDHEPVGVVLAEAR